MTRKSAALLAVVLACAVDTGIRLVPRSAPPRPTDVRVLAERSKALDLDAPYSASTYEFLPAVVGSASLVSLGESVHVTAELPRARLRLVQFLHERMGFDVLALEGSETQAWLAEEYLYRTSPGTAGRLERAQQMAWFKLWNTAEMRELLAYVDASQRTSHPLYLASFDVQTGASAAFSLTPAVLTALFDRLALFGRLAEATTGDLIEALTPVVQCEIGSASGLGPLRARALSAIEQVQRWTDAIEPAVAAERPATHVAALRMIPDNLRDHLELCEHATTWQQTRDELSADNALRLRDQVSATHKVLLWAHHSHVAYNSRGKQIPSMGQHLRDRMGRDLYTIGTFAGTGRFLDVAPLSVHALPGPRTVGVERLLSAAGSRPFFVDVSTLPLDRSAGWLTPMSSRMEGRKTAETVLAEDFDGAIFIPEVSPGTGMVPDGAFTALQLFGLAVDYPATALAGAIGLLIQLVLAIGRVRRHRRKVAA